MSLMILLAPNIGAGFGPAPSGTTYIPDKNGLIIITSGSTADQQALIAQGCAPITPFVCTVAKLPAAAVVLRALVTDSTATLVSGLGNIVGGGGSNFVPVYADGTNWRIG